jgi:hypothetical protein
LLLSLLALSLRRYLAFAGDDQLLKIVEIATGAVVAMGQGHSNKVRALLPPLIFISLPPRFVPATPTHAFSPAPLPHLSTTPIRHTTPHRIARQVRALAWTPDEKQLVSGGDDMSLCCWNFYLA